MYNVILLELPDSGMGWRQVRCEEVLEGLAAAPGKQPRKAHEREALRKARVALAASMPGSLGRALFFRTCKRHITVGLLLSF